MNKEEFLTRLRTGLAGLPEDELAERLAFYRDMIEDRVEDGLPEETAVEEIGPVEPIVTQILAERPAAPAAEKPAKEKRRLSAWEIVLLVLGFPLWFPLLIAAAVLVLAGLIVLWSLVLSLWAVLLSLFASALAGLFTCALSLVRGDGTSALALLGGCLILAGLSILLFFGCRAATAGAASLTKGIPVWVRALFHRKEKEV